MASHTVLSSQLLIWCFSFNVFCWIITHHKRVSGSWCKFIYLFLIHCKQSISSLTILENLSYKHCVWVQVIREPVPVICSTVNTRRMLHSVTDSKTRENLHHFKHLCSLFFGAMSGFLCSCLWNPTFFQFS